MVGGMDRTLLLTLHLVNATIWLVGGLVLTVIDENGPWGVIVLGAFVVKLLLWLGIAAERFHPTNPLTLDE